MENKNRSNIRHLHTQNDDMHKRTASVKQNLYKIQKSEKTFDFSTWTLYNIFKFIRKTASICCVRE